LLYFLAITIIAFFFGTELVIVIVKMQIFEQKRSLEIFTLMVMAHTKHHFYNLA
jgi:UDP-N-acetylmuramyl pentapeptide phosphotransferase/UDP-N-acetylglucosamine-1-phosphate transferase